MKTLRFIFLFLLVSLFSCKKDHTCYCNTPDGMKAVFTYHGPRSEARKQCKAYVASGTEAANSRCKLR